MALPLAVGIWAALSATIIPLAVRLLVGIGFAAVTFVGIGAAWDAAQAAIWSNLGGVSADVLTIVQMARIDDAIQVVLSAATARLLYAGLNAATGGITKGRWNPTPAP